MASKIFLKSLLYITLITAGFFLTFFIVYPQVSRCFFVSLSSFEKVQPSVYISEGTTQIEKDSLLKFLQHSDSRIIDFWKEKQSNPTIIYCDNEALYKKYGSETDSPANIFGTPIGSIIVIGPMGLNTDVISHETSHAELAERLGWLTMELSVPTWFNEGLALMVDYRFSNPDMQFRYEDYKKEWYRKTGFGATEVSLRDISSIKGFFQGESEDVYLSYLTSGLEVSRWLKRVGRDGLLEFIGRMNEGDGFGNAYLTVQRNEMKKFRFKEPYLQTNQNKRKPNNLFELSLLK
ncbi:MAG: hypothetical protein M3512_07970 [Bacteroidota bacterium]|nr:hypothetical protein [Bacteroidota bacterium]